MKFASRTGAALLASLCLLAGISSPVRAVTVSNIYDFVATGFTDSFPGNGITPTPISTISGSVGFSFDGSLPPTSSMQDFAPTSVSISFGSFSTSNVSVDIGVLSGGARNILIGQSSGANTNNGVFAFGWDDFALQFKIDSAGSVTFVDRLDYSTVAANAAFSTRSVCVSTSGSCLTAPAPVPLPAGLPLLGTALAGIGLARWRRKKKKTSTYRPA